MVALIFYFFFPIFLAVVLKKFGPKIREGLIAIPALVIWIPYEPSLFGLDNFLPNLHAVKVMATGIPVVLLLAVLNLFIVYFFILKKLKWREFLGKPNDIFLAVRSLFFLAPVLGLVAYSLDFIQFVPKTLEPSSALRWVQIFLLIALPEEILFRGIFQNAFEWSLNLKGRVVVILGALVFGFSHINNVTTNHTPPNLPYVVLATLAGLSYGYVYLKTRSLTASAIVHASVNFIWWWIFK